MTAGTTVDPVVVDAFVIDIGNSRVKAAVAEAGRLEPVLRWTHGQDAAWPPVRPRHVVVGSVVPTATEALCRTLPREWPAPRVVAATDFGVPLDVEEPTRLGVDRVANAAAAVCRFGDDCIVVDAGTATTVDLITDGVFRGGAILPGVQLMADSLTKRTALLPQVRVHEHPDAALPGRDTLGAIIGGVATGYAGAIAAVVRRLRDGRDFPLVACGGAAGMADLSDAVEVPTLTLEGLASRVF